jgi:hypothetical protein
MTGVCAPAVPPVKRFLRYDAGDENGEHERGETHSILGPLPVFRLAVARPLLSARTDRTRLTEK